MANHHDQGSEVETSEYIYTTNDTGGLTSTGAEAVSTEAVGDIVDDVTLDDPGLTRPPRRMRRKNVLYQGDWWVDHGGEEDE